jgi:hypothetical protein
MASLSSFLASNQYTRENISVPFVGAFVAGTGYIKPTFDNGGATADPGGLFGWLMYARTTESLNPAGLRGATSTDKYIVYTNPSDLVQDLNKLDGITGCFTGTAGATYAFFEESGTNLTPKKNGIDFIHAINYMAYGGSLVLAGSTSGLNTYLNSNANNKFDVIFDPYLTTDVINWVSSQPYTIGIFPSQAVGGITGLGFTLGNFSSVGSTNAIRYFSIYGTKGPANTTLATDTVKQNSTLTYKIAAVADVAGFFTRAKALNELYITVAGLDRSTVLNGKILETVLWNSEDKNTLRKARVNFFVTYTPPFLGSDLIGITASTNTVTFNDRVGPANLYTEIDQAVNNIGLKYVFEVNNATTRAEVVSEIQTALDRYSTFLETSKTEIICDSRNNTDNTSTLNIQVIVKPIIGVDSFVVNFSYTNN